MGHKFGCLLLKERNLKGLFMECFSNLSSTLVNEYFSLRKMENKSYSLAIFLIYQSRHMVAILSLKVPKRATKKHFVGRLSNMSFTLVNIYCGLKCFSNLSSSLVNTDCGLRVIVQSFFSYNGPFERQDICCHVIIIENQQLEFRRLVSNKVNKLVVFEDIVLSYIFAPARGGFQRLLKIQRIF